MSEYFGLWRNVEKGHKRTVKIELSVANDMGGLRVKSYNKEALMNSLFDMPRWRQLADKSKRR